ncbi:outer membrane beta-barrel protein [Parapedobacter koreensis]|uniref:Outer membrane protein beta-barrel family protein n=1 Tax=Parapedobacter koreensis TaxID=332977 RepID=A0A1H7TJ80_9SPHI|nr:outer membrane beta-barrel protein [Parapedobacter koreensis]SEL83897.1 Outer membrane protein beta-barrel family protein [Parapedobacter koreensis]
MNYTFADKLTTTLNYAHVSDVQSGIFRTQPGSPVLEEGFANVATKNSYGISVDYTEEITPWYSLSMAITANYHHFSGTLADESIDVGRASWLGQLANQFSFGKSWNAEVLANYQSTMQEDAISILHQMGQVNGTIGKQILNNNGSLRLLLIDPFNIGRYVYDSRLGNLTSDFKLRWDNRMVGLSFSYRFGSGKGAQARDQTSSMEEESSRL